MPWLMIAFAHRGWKPSAAKAQPDYNFAVPGYIIIEIFTLSWFGSMLIYRAKAYGDLERDHLSLLNSSRAARCVSPLAG